MHTVQALAKMIATAFGAGYCPVAPGTCGTLVTVPLAWVMAPLPGWQFAAITVAVIAIAIAAADVADRAWATEDNQHIVIDEVAGYLVTVAPVVERQWAPLAVGFVLFRVLDSVKPPPIRWLDERLPGGWGVVLDDVGAGVMGAVAMVALSHFGVFDYLGRL